MELDLYYGFELIKKAYEEKTNSMLWDMWLAKYPWMDKESFISFEDFKDKMLGQANEAKKPIETKEEIIDRAEKIVAVFNKSKGGKI